jgi:hypothetical protein
MGSDRRQARNRNRNREKLQAYSGRHDIRNLEF